MSAKYKKQHVLLITLISVFTFIILCASLIVTLSLTNKEGINIEDYNPPFENYQMYNDDDDYYIFYETINGYITCNCVLVYTEDNKVKTIDKHIMQYNETLSIDYNLLSNIDTKITEKAIELYQESEYYIDNSTIAYYVLNFKMTPIYVAAIFSKSMAKGTTICINLNNGQYINYEDIAIINY